MAASSPDPPPQRFGDLRIRIATAIAAAAVGLVLLYLGGIWTMLLIAAVAGAMTWEYRSITLHRGGACGFDVAFLMTGVVGAVVVAELYSPPLAVLWLIWMLIGSALGDMTARRRGSAAWGMLGGAYIGGAAIAFHFLRAQEPLGFVAALWLFLVVAAADIGGYFAGRLVGGPKLWPRVSPKKTWAGLFGAVGLAILAGALFSFAVRNASVLPVCAASGIAAVIAQGGDLAESAVKRHFGVKDSGQVMPGHGGALDRFDGLVAAALAAGLLTWWRGETVFVW
jgi:phosphatidate cytidylyltransferase